MPARVRLEPWPLGLAAALCFMVGTSVGFWRLADANRDALVVQDTRAAERGYSERVRAARRAEALGWSIELETALRPGTADVRVAVRDAGGRSLPLDRVALRRERPAEGGLDADVELVQAGEGFAGAVALPRPGRWHLRVRAERGAEVAERAFAVWAP